MSNLFRRRLFSIFLFVAYVFLAPGARADVLATVNGDSITSDMMAEELSRIHMMQVETVHRAEFRPDRLLQKLINNRLIVQEAEEIGLGDDPEIAAAVKRHREVLAYRALMAESLPDTFTVSEADVRTEFERLYERLDLRSICVADSALAFRLVEDIRGGVPMDRLAREHSVDRFKDEGGLAADQSVGSLPGDVHRALTEGQIGDLIGPRYLWRVWVILRIEGRRPADTSLFDDQTRAELRSSVYTRKRNDHRRQFVDRLRRTMTVEIDTAQVDSIMVRMGLGLDETDIAVATIGGNRTLTASSLRNKYIHQISGRIEREPRIVLYETLNEQVDILVLKEAAERSEVVNRPEFDVPVSAFRDSLLVSYYLEDVVGPSVKITDKEVADIYERSKSSFRGPAQYKIATITRDTQEQAQADYEAAGSGTDFAWLARRHSTDNFKAKGGERNWLSASAFPDHILAEFDSLSRGGVTRPAPVDEGYIVMKLLERKDGEQLPLDEVSERIRVHLLQQKLLQAIDASVKALRDVADIRINEKTMNDLQITGPSAESVQTED